MLARRTVMAQATAESASQDNRSTSPALNGKTHSTKKNGDEDSVNILVFETDEPHPDTIDNKGSFGQIFHELFSDAGAKHDPPLNVTTSMHYIVDDPRNGHDGHVPSASQIPDDTTAILITGSMYDAHGNDAWVMQLLELLKELWTTRPEILFSGVCFGHQILARLLGAKVEPENSGTWELSHTEMELSPVGKKLFRTDSEKLSVHQMHQDHVATVPSTKTTDLLKEDQKVHVWASTEHTKIQGLYIRDRMFTSQGHLGFDEKMVCRQIQLRQESGAIGDGDKEEVEEAKETAHMKHDGVVVAGAILRFFYGEDHDVD